MDDITLSHRGVSADSAVRLRLTPAQRLLVALRWVLGTTFAVVALWVGASFLLATPAVAAVPVSTASQVHLKGAKERPSGNPEAGSGDSVKNETPQQHHNFGGPHVSINVDRKNININVNLHRPKVEWPKPSVKPPAPANQGQGEQQNQGQGGRQPAKQQPVSNGQPDSGRQHPAPPKKPEPEKKPVPGKDGRDHKNGHDHRKLAEGIVKHVQKAVHEAVRHPDVEKALEACLSNPAGCSEKVKASLRKKRGEQPKHVHHKNAHHKKGHPKHVHDKRVKGDAKKAHKKPGKPSHPAKHTHRPAPVSGQKPTHASAAAPAPAGPAADPAPAPQAAEAPVAVAAPAVAPAPEPQPVVAAAAPAPQPAVSNPAPAPASQAAAAVDPVTVLLDEIIRSGEAAPALIAKALLCLEDGTTCPPEWQWLTTLDAEQKEALRQRLLELYEQLVGRPREEAGTR